MFNSNNLVKEISFSAVRSGGPGGQHANKVSSKVVLVFNILDSSLLSAAQKEVLLQKLARKLNSRGDLILTCDETRSQHKNKEIAVKRLTSLIEGSLKKTKRRVPTKVSRAEKARRIEAKKKKGLKKSLRQKPRWD